LGAIPNREESIRKLVRQLAPVEQLRACYEAGPTGYVLYWQLTALSVRCDVIAPTLIPMKSGDRVKTDRRDAEKLARCLRALVTLRRCGYPTLPMKPSASWCGPARSGQTRSTTRP